MNEKYARTNNICLVFITLCTATAAITYMRPMLIPLIFAIFTYAVLAPVVQFIQSRLRAPRALAILATLILLVLSLIFVALVLINSVEDFIAGAPKYQESLNALIHTVEGWLGIMNVELELDKIRELIPSALSKAQTFASQILGFLSKVFLVFIFTIFMMIGTKGKNSQNPLQQELMFKVSSYISTKFFLSVTTGFFVWLVLLWFNIELAFIFALLTVLLNFIPTIGSIIAVVVPLPIVILQYKFGFEFWTILALSGMIQFVIGNIIEPVLMGDSMDLHPITILLSLIFWGMAWGIPGMFLAVPVTAVIKIVFSKIEATQSFAEILAGRLPQSA